MSNLAINDAGDVLEFDGQQWKPARMAQNDAGEKVVYDGSAWKPLGALVGAAKGGKAQGRSDAMATSFGQGATMGFGDELTAAVRAAMPGVSNFMMRGPALQRDESIGGSPTPQTVSTAPTYQGRYDEELARQRAQLRSNAEAHPALTTGANIAGNIAGIGAATLAGLPTAPAMGAGLGGNMLRMGAAGAAYGGAQGFGEGEGGFERRAESAIMPAAFGGAFGAAMPVAGAAVRAGAESAPGQWIARNVAAPVTQRIAAAVEGVPRRSLSAAAPDGTPSVAGPLTQFSQSVEDPARAGAIDRLATAMQRSGMSREQIERRLAQLGPEAMLADLDPQLMSQARMANTMPGETRTWAKNVLESRDRQAGNRLVSAFEGSEPPPSSFALRGEGQAFDKYASAVGERAYGAMRDQKLRVSTEMQRIMAEAPDIGEAIATIQSQTKGTGTRLSPIELIDRVKQYLNKTADAAFASGKVLNKADLAALADRFETAFWRANPEAQTAAQAYRLAKSLPEYFDAGRSFLRRGSSESATEASAPALAELLAGANGQQVVAARAGATNAARETALEGTRPARALAQRIDESTPVRDKLAELYGAGPGSRIMSRASTERTFAETSNDILRGSKTADKAAEIFDNAGVRIGASGASPRLWERFVDIAKAMTGPNESVRNQIGRMTLTADAERNAEILRLAFEALRKRQAGQPLAAALAGSGGASLSGAR